MKKMADIFKFVYDMIFFVSVFLIVVYGESKLILICFLSYTQNISLIFSNIFLFLFYMTEECISDAVCYEKYPGPFNFIMNCVDGYCKAFPKLV